MDLFDKVNKRLGYGIMAPPFIDDETVDIPKFQQLVDYLIPKGYNYFETGRPYMEGACEKAFKECISSKYPRESYAISNKLSPQNLYNIEETFQSQLETCGVDYFDVYLMHGQDWTSYIEYKQAGAYNKILEYKKQGKIKHFGISFHDNAQVLEAILIAEPEIEIVQIQFNYFDYEDDVIQSKLLYEVCSKYNKKIIVMKPNRGPFLSRLPSSVRNLVQEVNYNNYSDASYAFRFVKEFKNIWMILTCVRSLEEAADNINTMENLPPLNSAEKEMLYKITLVLRNNMNIPCVQCGYCITYCPLKNNIPELIQIMNLRRQYYKISDDMFYNNINLNINCLECGQCTKICPQKIPVMELITRFKNSY